MKTLTSHKYNVLLVKDGVGVPKPSTRDLPSDRFAFGRPEVPDPEDAQKGKQSWQALNDDVYSYLGLGVLQVQRAEEAGQGL